MKASIFGSYMAMRSRQAFVSSIEVTSFLRIFVEASASVSVVRSDAVETTAQPSSAKAPATSRMVKTPAAAPVKWANLLLLIFFMRGPDASLWSAFNRAKSEKERIRLSRRVFRTISPVHRFAQATFAKKHSRQE